MLPLRRGLRRARLADLQLGLSVLFRRRLVMALRVARLPGRLQGRLSLRLVYHGLVNARLGHLSAPLGGPVRYPVDQLAEALEFRPRLGEVRLVGGPLQADLGVRRPGLAATPGELRMPGVVVRPPGARGLGPDRLGPGLGLADCFG